MASEVLTSIPLTSLPRIAKGKVRYASNVTPKDSAFLFSANWLPARSKRRSMQSPWAKNARYQHPEILFVEWTLTCRFHRDLFALPDGDKPTLLFATSGMLPHQLRPSFDNL